MKAVLQNPKTGKLVVDEIPPPVLRPEGILVRVRRSVIGLGTERSVVAVTQLEPESNAKQPTSLLRRILSPREDAETWSRYSVVKNLRPSSVPLGYSCSGVVTRVGSEVTEFRVGERVACYGLDFANHAEVNYIPRNLAVKIPDELSNNAAAFVALGATALQAVRQAEVQLGDRVVVMGLGLIGQIVAQLVRASGATVLVTDSSTDRCDLARKLGAHQAVSDSKELREDVAQFTQRHGADIVILCSATDTNDVLRVAADCSRRKGKVVLMGDVGNGLERRPIFDKEIQLVSSHGFGDGRLDADYEIHGREYPLPLVRWTERRNGEAFLEMLARGTLDIESLISAHYPIEEAAEAFRALTSRGPSAPISVVLDYHRPTEEERGSASVRTTRRAPQPAESHIVHLGTIGAGNFAKGVLLPAFHAQFGVRMQAFCTSSGPTSKAVAEQFGASFCTSNPEEVISSPEVNTILVTTRHDQHAPLALAALKADKAVFLDAPLCIRPSELVNLARNGRNASPRLMVGHSRRFAPLAVHCRNFFADVADPLQITYRINALALADESWIRDSKLGGGRILSELGHFVDMACYLSDSLPAKISAEPIGVPSSPHPNRDSLSVTIRMRNDSLAVIHFLTGGDSSASRERVEVFGGGRTGILEDFRKLALHYNGRRRVKKLPSQQKGFRELAAAFVSAVRSGTEMPTPYETLIAVSRTCFLIQESIESGEPIEYSEPCLPAPSF